MATPPSTKPAYARWRVVTLVLVHVLFAAHIVHWKLAGKTLAPLELNELMYTLEAGIITAGFLFMLLVILSVAIFGRFFCSWGCHILALQDSCSWLMAKLGARPRMVRSRALAIVPMGAMLYMFVWPQIQFVFLNRPRPSLHITDDSSGWASFVTEDFWRNLPAPGIALLTFAICGFGFVYFMGHRSFCRYACPYGAIFALTDRIAPGKIARVGDCSACGKCSAACQSDIRVHEELEAHGQVVNSACMKDLDCLVACPNGAIGFRFQRPSLFRSRKVKQVAAKASMFSKTEEIAMAVAFVPLVMLFRGLYGLLPFLLSLALAGMTAYVAVLCVRLLRQESVAFVRYRLKAAGKWRSSGKVFVACAATWLLFVAHSAVLRAETWRGMQVVASAASLQQLDIIESGVQRLERVERLGLLTVPEVSEGIAELEGRSGMILAEQGRMDQACLAFEAAVHRLPDSGMLRFNYGRVLSAIGRMEDALWQNQVATELMPEDLDAANNLGFVLMQLGQFAQARTEFERAIALDDDFPHAHFNLGRVHLEGGDQQSARLEFQRAAALDPMYAEWWRVNEPDLFAQ